MKGHAHRLTRGDVAEVRDRDGNLIATISRYGRWVVVVEGEEVRIDLNPCAVARGGLSSGSESSRTAGV